MNKICKQFLCIAFAISYLSFGVLAYTRMPFPQFSQHPFYMFLFVEGCLGPLIASLLVFHWNKDVLGGIKGFWELAKRLVNPVSIPLTFLFLGLHYGLAIVLRAVGEFGQFSTFFKFIPLMLILFGSQEIGWRGIVQPLLSESKGFLKSAIITGLLQAMWFLPLIFIPGFVVQPGFFAQFAAYMVGMGMLSTTLYKQSGGLFCCIGFVTLFFSLSTLISVRQSSIILALVAIDILISVSYNSKVFEK